MQGRKFKTRWERETGLHRLWSFKLITEVLGEPFRVLKWVSDVISFASERCI